MKRVAGLFVVVLLVAASVWWGLRRQHEEALAPRPGPAPVPEGETVLQTLPDADGNPEVWKLRKREIPRAELPDLVLPAPAQREAPPDERTESARALDTQALEAWKHGDLRQALALFEAAVEADPDDWLPRANYGRLLVLMTAYQEAYPHLERAAQLRPEEPRVWLDLLSFYERNQLLERAFYARERAEALVGGQSIVRDETGLWRLEADSVFP